MLQRVYDPVFTFSGGTKMKMLAILPLAILIHDVKASGFLFNLLYLLWISSAAWFTRVLLQYLTTPCGD